MAITLGVKQNVTHKGTSFSYDYFPGRGKKLPTLSVWIDVQYAADLVLSSESAFDRFAKAAGIAVELQTGDAEFDRSCYITCASAQFANKALSNPQAKKAVLKLLAMGAYSIEHHGSVLE